MLHGTHGAKNQFHFHMLFTFNDDTKLESLRDARLSENMFVCFSTVVMNAPDLVPRDHSDLLKQSNFNFFKLQ